MPQKLEAKVKDSYNMGPVMAFSGREYVRSEWRAVPAGFEPAAIVHPLLDVREKDGEEIKVTSQEYLDQAMAETVPVPADEPVTPAKAAGVTTETVPEEPKKRARRSSKKED